MPSADKAFLVDSTKLERGEVWGETDKAVHWNGAFAVYGGHGATASSVIVYEIEPGKRLGWHTDATEETQYIIAGTGKLYLEDGSVLPIGPGSVFVLPTPMRHDVESDRQRDASRCRLLRRRHVHPGLRSGDDAAEDPHPRHAQPHRLSQATSPTCGGRPCAIRPWPFSSRARSLTVRRAVVHLRATMVTSST